MSGKKKTKLPPPPTVSLPELKQHTALTPLKAQPSKRQRRKNAKIRGSEARTVRTGGRRIFTSLYPLSTLDGKMLAGEAAIEGDFWVVADFIYPNLVDAVAQPFTIPIEVLGETHDWTPDALLSLEDGTQILVETKPLIFFSPADDENPTLDDGLDDFDDDRDEIEEDDDDPALVALAYLDAWKAAAAERGVKFLAMTEAEVRLEPRFYNAKVMHRAMGSPLRTEVRDIAIAALVEGPAELTVAEFSGHLGDHRLSALLIAAHLDQEGLVRIDRTNFWSPKSSIQNLISHNGPAAA